MGQIFANIPTAPTPAKADQFASTVSRLGTTDARFSELLDELENKLSIILESPGEPQPAGACCGRPSYPDYFEEMDAVTSRVEGRLERLESIVRRIPR